MKAFVAMTLVAVVAAACSSSVDRASDDGGGGGSDVDPTGILKVAVGLELPGGLHFDPTRSHGTDLQWMQLVLGTLLRVGADGSFEPMMAKSYELVDPSTVSFTLHDGMEFTDGTPYDAQAVKVGLLRTRDQVALDAKPSQDSSIAEIEDVSVDGPTVLTVTLKSPVAGQFLAAMTAIWGAIVSPTQARQAPDDINFEAIGAGPYTLASVKNNQSISLRKNPDYWDASSWRLAGIEFANVAEDSSKINALKTGTYDLVERLSADAIGALRQEPSVRVASAFVEASLYYLALCTGKPPFDREKVRQAINVGIDREQLNDLVFGGVGEPAYGMWPKSFKYHDPDLKAISEYDPTKARRLLTDAGASESTFDLYYPSAPLPGIGRIAEALQAQLGKIGVTVKIVPGDVLTGFVVPQRPGAMLIPASRVGVAKYLSVFGAGQRLALCGVSHQEIVDALQPATAMVSGSDAATPLFRQADETIAKHAYLVPVVFAPRVNAYVADRIGGTPKFETIDASPMFDSIYITKR